MGRKEKEKSWSEGKEVGEILRMKWRSRDRKRWGQEKRGEAEWVGLDA